ncbi:MAG: hypothetical protein ARM1_0706 [Candidatus Micrarchaeota archaeon]|nr:MAG: hypothetical protein ARM1_0706 [Candidatus Micrarchaeota archaeon]
MSNRSKDENNRIDYSALIKIALLSKGVHLNAISEIMELFNMDEESYTVFLHELYKYLDENDKASSIESFIDSVKELGANKELRGIISSKNAIILEAKDSGDRGNIKAILNAKVAVGIIDSFSRANSNTEKLSSIKVFNELYKFIDEKLYSYASDNVLPIYKEEAEAIIDSSIAILSTIKDISSFKRIYSSLEDLVKVDGLVSKTDLAHSLAVLNGMKDSYSLHDFLSLVDSLKESSNKSVNVNDLLACIFFSKLNNYASIGHDYLERFNVSIRKFIENRYNDLRFGKEIGEKSDLTSNIRLIPQLNAIIYGPYVFLDSSIRKAAIIFLYKKGNEVGVYNILIISSDLVSNRRDIFERINHNTSQVDLNLLIRLNENREDTE